MLSSNLYSQLLVAFALIFGATVGIADAVADAAIADADVPGKLADEPSAAPSVVSQPAVVAPASAAVPSDAPSAAPSVDPSAAPSALVSGAPSAAPSGAPSASVSVPEVLPAALNTVEATRAAVAARNLPAWLLAFSSLLWTVVAVLRRYGRLNNRRAVAAFTLVAAVLGGLASQLLLGVNAMDALVIAFGGPGAVALNEFLRAFGFFASSNPGSGDLPRADA